ncbi:MAG: hypothetical protein H2069_10160 [Legionella sp.]|nr:hypothetical protein [Legionella sp.]
MSSAQKDLLAKGLTKETQILRVPLKLAILNAGLMAVVMLVCVLFSLPVMSLLITLLCLPINHLLLMILTLQDDKAVQRFLVDKANCFQNPLLSAKGQGAQYTPLENLAREVATKSWRGALSYFLNPAVVKDDSLSRHLPYTHLVNEQTVALKRAGLVQVLALAGIHASTLNASESDLLKELRNRFLYGITNPNLTVHAYLIKDADETFAGGVFPEGFANAVNTAYQSALTQKKLSKHRLYLAFVFKSPSEDSLKRLTGITNKALKQLHPFQPRRLSFTDKGCSELLSFLGYLVNQREQRFSLPRQALATVLGTRHVHFFKAHGVMVFQGMGKKQYGAILYIKEYPEDSMAGMLDGLLGMGGDFVLHQSFQCLAPRKAVSALEDQQTFMMQADESISLTTQIDLNLDDLKAGRLAYGLHALKLLVKADSLEQLDARITQVETKLNDHAAIVLAQEFQGLEIAYWSMLPGNENYSVRDALVSTKNLASLASLHNLPPGQLTGHHWGHALTTLETAQQTRFHFSVHVNQVGNAMLIGPMGSGKTVVLAKMLVDMAKFNGWRFVFDKDSGMELTVRAMGGAYCYFTPGTPTGIAPLQLPDTSENRAFNRLLLEKILSTQKTLNASDSKVITQAIDGIYRLSMADRTFTNLAPFFGADRPGSLREAFTPWYGQGGYAWLFDNVTDAFQIANQMTGFDIGNLLKAENTHLTTPLLMVLFHRIDALLDGSPTAIFIPEGWRMMADRYFQKQLSDWSKTPRKKNLAIIMDTQSPADLAQNDAGCSLAKAAVTQIFFAHDGAEWKDYDLFDLSEKEFHIIQQELPALGGHFFLLKQGGQSIIARADLSSLSDLLPILSSNEMRAKLLARIRQETGDAWADWQAPYLVFDRLREQQFAGSIDVILKQFDTLWERYRCGELPS